MMITTVGAVIKAINTPYFIGKGGVDKLSMAKTFSVITVDLYAG